MKIIIVGCGKVGSTLAEHLNQEGHDITIIDKHWDKLKFLSDRIDVLGVEGNGASIIIRGDIYPNVYICIDTAKLCITRKESYTRYVCKNNTIERRTIPVGSI